MARKREPSGHEGVVTCMKCRKPFKSPDKRRVRRCRRCKKLERLDYNPRIRCLGGLRVDAADLEPFDPQ